MTWNFQYTDEAKDDLNDFSKSQILQIEKMIMRVSENPLPQNEGGYGKPLGNKQGRNLTGLCKIKLKKPGIRVVYRLVRTAETMEIIVVAARGDDEVYDIAAKRNK